MREWVGNRVLCREFNLPERLLTERARARDPVAVRKPLPQNAQAPSEPVGRRDCCSMFTVGLSSDS